LNKKDRDRLVERINKKASTKSSPSKIKIPQIIDPAGFMFVRRGATRTT